MTVERWYEAVEVHHSPVPPGDEEWAAWVLREASQLLDEAGCQVAASDAAMLSNWFADGSNS